MRAQGEEFEVAVRRALAGLGAGQIATYDEIAEEAGYPGAARAVGRLLAVDGGSLPWWRVVTSTGRLVPGHERRQAELLRAEGVALRDGRARRPDRRTGPRRSADEPRGRPARGGRRATGAAP